MIFDIVNPLFISLFLAMENIIQINHSFIEETTSFPDIINLLENAFAKNTTLVPMRHHHDFPNPEKGSDSTLLLMPAWNPGTDAGVKLVTVNPENVQTDLPSIQGIYIYFDSTNGIIKAILDAKNLTAKRTAAASALASSYLSRENSSTLLMIGTGALSTNLIRAHACVRPIRKVFVWGRDFRKAQNICKQLKNEKYSVEAIHSIKEKIETADIISCATLSKEPLILGRNLCEGQHIDLVGSFKPDMRESDDDAILKSTLFVDTMQGVLKESGDILKPIQNGLISENDIKSDFFDLCSKKKMGRESDKEITLFKSVGHALEDITAAAYYYKMYNKTHKS